MDAGAKRISIIMPCYNERDTVLQAVEEVRRVPLPIRKEIIVVDDGSTDGSREIISHNLPKEIKAILMPENRGKGAAIREGLRAATGDFVIIQDTDLEQDPNDYNKLLAPLLDGTADVVYGTRMLNYRTNSQEQKMVFLATLLLNLSCNILYGSTITDVMTGYKAFRKSLLDSLDIRSRGFEFETEVTAKILRKGCLIHEIPVRVVRWRSREEGKKISWLDGPKILYYLIKFRIL